INRLVEIGHDPLQVAAIALKIARKEEKQRPIAQISEVQEGHSLKGHPVKGGPLKEKSQKARHEIKSIKKRNGRNGFNGSCEEGMVRLTLNAGKYHGVRPADVVGTIAYHAKFPGSAIGAINILDKHTLVDVPEQYLEQTLAKAGKYQIRRNTVKLELA
ncbi:DbpA RNA binding domain-containing protein, partial [Chloroflexota bacterium]